jgi:hypothetical protein
VCSRNARGLHTAKCGRGNAQDSSSRHLPQAGKGTQPTSGNQQTSGAEVVKPHKRHRIPDPREDAWTHHLKVSPCTIEGPDPTQILKRLTSSQPCIQQHKPASDVLPSHEHAVRADHALNPALALQPNKHYTSLSRQPAPHTAHTKGSQCEDFVSCKIHELVSRSEKAAPADKSSKIHSKVAAGMQAAQPAHRDSSSQNVLGGPRTSNSSRPTQQQQTLQPLHTVPPSPDIPAPRVHKKPQLMRSAPQPKTAGVQQHENIRRLQDAVSEADRSEGRRGLGLGKQLNQPTEGPPQRLGIAQTFSRPAVGLQSSARYRRTWCVSHCVNLALVNPKMSNTEGPRGLGGYLGPRTSYSASMAQVFAFHFSERPGSLAIHSGTRCHVTCPNN